MLSSFTLNRGWGGTLIANLYYTAALYETTLHSEKNQLPGLIYIGEIWVLPIFDPFSISNY